MSLMRSRSKRRWKSSMAAASRRGSWSSWGTWRQKATAGRSTRRRPTVAITRSRFVIARDSSTQKVARRTAPRGRGVQSAREDHPYGSRHHPGRCLHGLCGHATLASAHVLWEQGHLARTAPARFHTKSGLLTCEAKGAWIEMDFPAKREAPAVPPPELGPALGASMKYVGRNAFDYLVEVDAETTVRDLRPDHARLRRLPVRGLMVTALSASPAYDFISRFFAPG